MKYNFQPQSELEKFGSKIYNLLVDNFSQTYFVGGMVRDLLLQKPVSDIDIASAAHPQDVKNILHKHGIVYDSKNEKFGVITATQGNCHIEVTTLRVDAYAADRYPHIRFVSNAREDSKRRDFTINSLYLSHKTGEILDFTTGLKDIKRKTVKFIGNPETRTSEDPLRILRALRFALTLNFTLEKKTFLAIKNNMSLAKRLTATRKQMEINKLQSIADRKILQQALRQPKLLDKYFQKF